MKPIKPLFVCLILAGIVVGAVLVRLLAGPVAGPRDLWVWIQITYLEIAANLASGRGYWLALAPDAMQVQALAPHLLQLQQLPHDYAHLQRPIQYYLPAYAYLISLTLSITGRLDWAVPQAFNAVTDGLVGPPVAYLILTRGGSSQLAGVLAAALYAASPSLARMAAQVMPDSLSTMLSLLPVACVAVGRGRPWFALSAALAGFCVGLACAFRGEMVALLPLIGVLVALASAGQIKRRLAMIGFVVLGWLLGTAPLAVFWNSAYGYPALSRPGLGIRLWEGIGAFPNPWGVQEADEAAGALLATHGLEYGTPAGDSLLVQESVTHFREAPMFLARSVAVRGPDVVRFGLDGWGDWAPIPYARQLAGLPSVVFVVLVAIGVVATLRRWPFLFSMLACLWLARVLPFSFLEVQPRDLLPVQFATMAWAACGAASGIAAAVGWTARHRLGVAQRVARVVSE